MSIPVSTLKRFRRKVLAGLVFSLLAQPLQAGASDTRATHTSDDTRDAHSPGETRNTHIWRPLVMRAALARCLSGAEPARVGFFACADGCQVIPWQLDERDGGGEIVLDRGPGAGADGDGGRIDGNDELVWMWSDAAHRTDWLWSPNHVCVDEIRLRLGDEERWVYAVLHAGRAPRSARRYVEYDVADDRMSGASVDVGFGGPTPRQLALRRGDATGRDLLDRLKIRASGRFFGVFPLYRDESHIQSVYEAWRVGAIRVLRRERKWVRLAFGFRTPYLRTETTFYRDFVALPVRLRLNFPPAKLLAGIEIRAALDFLNLAGWRLWLPGLSGDVVVGEAAAAVGRALAAAEGGLLALRGADSTFALVLRLGPTLATVAKKIYYRETAAPDGPEERPGEMPGIGFRLVDWGAVAAGHHWFVAESYALPAGYDPAVFASELELEPRIDVATVSRRR